MNPPRYPGPPPGGGYGAPPPGGGYGAPPPGYYPAPAHYPPPYGAGALSAEDESQLNLLAVFYFIYAGLVALVGLFFGIYIVLGIALATDPTVSSGSGPPPAAIGGIFAAIGAIAMLLMWGKAALLVWSAISLRARRRWVVSFVVACITALNIPIGTALGIFTLVVLNRPSVKARYQESELAHAS
jgi:uncharacterized membrane protein YedE/YeeE